MTDESVQGSAAHRWEWDEDALTGVEYGYCANGCGVDWRDGDPEPTGPCAGSNPPLRQFVMSQEAARGALRERGFDA